MTSSAVSDAPPSAPAAGRGAAGLLRTAAPATVPALTMAVALVVWQIDGGFDVARWAPGLLLAAGLVAVSVAQVPARVRTLPPAVLVAVAGLLAYALWSLLSVIWAQDPGAAWAGAARTFVPVACFALFALWPLPGRGAAALVGLISVASGIVGAVWLVRLGVMDRPRDLFGDDRLLGPTGYPNATACLLTFPAVSATVLAAGARAPLAARVVLAALAVALLDLALLCLSRGMLVALPLSVVLVLVLEPNRGRVLAALAVVGAGAVIAVPRLLDVGDAMTAAGDPAGTVHRALALVAVGVLVSAVLAALATVLERRFWPQAEAERRLGRIGAVAAAVVVVAGVAVFVAVGHPSDRAHHAWRSFKGGYGDNDASSNRLVGGLGSNRYDFYRVGLDVFRAHPVAGVGADNFQGEYLRRGRSNETPRYPHSIELRALAQTGIVGFVLLFGGLAAAAVGALTAMRRADPAARAAGGAAFAGFTYWLVHGSADWLLEFGGMSGVVFALLGVACGLQPRRAVADGPTRPLARGPLARVAVALALLALCLPALSVWSSSHERDAAARVFATDPRGANARLDLAADLDPFTASADTLKGSIALRYDQLDAADAAFAAALKRAHHDAYSTLERGAIASSRGDRGAAVPLLQRAATLSPRDPLTQEALAIARAGGRIDVAELNRRIRASALRLTR